MKEFFFINLGQLGIMFSVLLVAMRVSRAIDAFEDEHEMLVDWMCEIRGMDKSKLPSRRRHRRFLGGIIPWNR